jgi:hypothetical protein
MNCSKSSLTNVDTLFSRNRSTAARLISAERWFLLNTNVPSETLRPIPDPSVTASVRAHSDVQFVSVVSIGELRRGAALLVQGSARRLQLGPSRRG